MGRRKDISKDDEVESLASSVRVSYCFVCGCGKQSQMLEKDYVRLPPGNAWFCKDCSANRDGIEFKGGLIARKGDF